jgi:acetyltransferase-like isoleucine patch superfamily enzyme
MKSIIKKIVRSSARRLFNIAALDEFIFERQKMYKRDFRNSFIGNDVLFLPSAEIHNMQADTSKIVIGEGSQIAGTLLIVPYGGKISIGKNCYLGDHSRIWSAEDVFIGDNVLISHNVNIMDTDSHEIDALERAEGYKVHVATGHPKEKGSVCTGAVYIENNVWIGFNAIVLKGVSIGEGAIVAAGSVVTKNIAPYTLVAGNPAVAVKEL